MAAQSFIIKKQNGEIKVRNYINNISEDSNFIREALRDNMIRKNMIFQENT